jgi:hypothetical protein
MADRVSRPTGVGDGPRCDECRDFYRGIPTHKHDLELGCAPDCPCQHKHAAARVGDGLPDDAVEALARAFFSHGRPVPDSTWEAFKNAGDDGYRRCMDFGRLALAAALPAIRRHIADQITSKETTAAIAGVFIDAMPFGDWPEAMRYAHEAALRVAVRVARGGETDG